MDTIIKKHPNDEFLVKLSESQHIFREIYETCEFKFQFGCGSYLFDGVSYQYCDLMYEKQKLLYDIAKTAKKVLEIGTYMGHSLLIMLLANPSLKITCIDISDEFTGPAVKVLNKHFNNAITFIHKDSLSALKAMNEKFDFFHIDGHHENDYISQEFMLIQKLNNNKDDILRVLFDDQISLLQLQSIIKSNYDMIKYVRPQCSWNNVYFEIKLIDK